MSSPASDADLYRLMRRIRDFETWVSRLYRDGEIPGFSHVSIGQEAAAAGVCSALGDEDIITSTHRGHGHVLAKGAAAESMFAELMGRRGGCCGGFGGSMHIADFSIGIFGANGIVGAGLPIAVGAAFALKRRGTGAVAVAFLGDGAVAQGSFHESLNLAAIWHLPVLFVCENNGFAEFSRTESQHPVEPAERAVAYAMRSVKVEARDAAVVRTVTEDLLSGLRAGAGPALLELTTDRWHGHYEGDPVSYRPNQDDSEMRQRDPLLVVGSRLTVSDRTAIDVEVADEMQRAVDIARAQDPPDAGQLSHLTFAPRDSAGVEALDHGAEMKYMDAINLALQVSLEGDPRVYVAGIDVGAAGGIFRVTAGLQQRFGPERVIDTPIAESALVGMAVGSAMAGLRPVIEIMFIDFLGVCFDQVINQAAKLRFMTGGLASVPLVIRTQFGAGRSSAAQHSQSLEGLVAAIPGLEVVMPATPADAYGLLRSAILSPNPVIFIEHRHLYGTRGPAPQRDHLVPMGKAAVVRPGRDVTLVATGRLVHEGLAAAAALARQGIDVEVIDLRSIVPLDTETLAESVTKTGRLAVAHEAPAFYGPGNEVIASVIDHAFWHLDAPPVRITPPATPAPYAPEVERQWLPDRHRIVAELQRLAQI